MLEYSFVRQSTLDLAVSKFSPLCERYATGELDKTTIYLERDIMVRALRTAAPFCQGP